MVDIPLVKAFLEMPIYAKFIKNLVTKKRDMDFEIIEVSHNYSTIMLNNMIVNKENTNAFTIPCKIDAYQIVKDLYDLGVNINLMSLVMFKKLGLGVIKATP